MTAAQEGGRDREFSPEIAGQDGDLRGPVDYSWGGCLGVRLVRGQEFRSLKVERVIEEPETESSNHGE